MAKKYVALPAGTVIKAITAANESAMKIEAQRVEVTKHLGQLAVYTNNQERNAKPRIVTIQAVYPNLALLSYPCYAPDGSYRQDLHESVTWVDLYCQAVTLEYLDCDDI